MVSVLLNGFCIPPAPISREATVQSLFVVDKMTAFLFISLSTSIVFKQNTNTFKLPSVTPWPLSKPYLIISEGQITYCYTARIGPCLACNIYFLFGQFLNDNSGYGIPARRCITSGVVGTGPHPHGHIHQPCFHTLAQPFNWREKRRAQINFREHPNCLQRLKLLFYIDELPKT